MRGRKPQPTAPMLPDPMACPEDLHDPVARRAWQRVIVPAVEAGQLTADDWAVAFVYCSLWAQWRAQIAEAAKHPHIVASGPNHSPVPNPAQVMANESLALLTKAGDDLDRAKGYNERRRFTEAR